MSGLVLLTLALTLSGQLDLPTSTDSVIGEQAVLTGDKAVVEGRIGRASGHALLRSGSSVLRADELTYDFDKRVAVASGNVLLVSNGLAGFADRLTVDLSTRQVEAEGGTFFQKEGVTPQALVDLAGREDATARELTQTGTNAFSFTARRFRLLEDNAYQVEPASFTASCGCDVFDRSWRITASSAKLTPGERATFTSPTLRVFDVPVFWVPWISLPLRNRQSGLLMPEWTASGVSGFQVDLPLFLTLGRSYDLTLSPGYAFGSGGAFGVKGPRLAAEFRYAPAPGVDGRVWLRLYQDLKLEREPLDPNVLAPDAGQRGLRGWGIFEHRQELGHGLHARADVTLYSDGFLFADTTTASNFLRSYYYVPSTATLYHRGEDHYAGLALAYRQDVRWGYPLIGDASRPPVFQELPTLRYAIPTVPLFGPLTGSVQVELSRLSPLRGLLGDEGTDGVFWPLLADADGTQGNGRFDLGERQARSRLDILPRVNATFDMGGVLRFTPYLAVRESLYLYEVTRETHNRAYGMVGLLLDSELSRVFGTGASAIRHSIMPSVELRAVPRVFGERAPSVYDEVDAAVPENGFFQGQVALRQKLLMRSGTGTRELGRLDVVQGVDFLERRMGETSGRLLTVIGPVTATATARLDLFTPNVEERLTQLSASVGWSVLRNGLLDVNAGYERTLGSSEQVRRPIDMLLPPPLPATAPVGDGGSCSDTNNPALQQVDRVLFGAGTRLPFGLGVRYDAEVFRRAPGRCDVVQVNSQTLTLSYTPQCNCFQIQAYGRLVPAPVYFQQGLFVTIANLGTFGG
ncbi:LPS-assembly protein LptD [Archangium violaceum]|uniref:LPS-assembly protein LptD n=1 Tax=Archangium violaceum TaxID=83451 RepID=UPI00193C5621|nr:LPS assembly protein LptD [Archangium violaceum]QRK06537.1 LPS-assembly protein LptD [Archangium violaceum]